MGSPMMKVDVGPPDAGARYIGLQRLAALTNPAAGSDWGFTVPGGTWCRVLAISCLLQTSAAVAARVPLFALRDSDGGEFWTWTPTAAVPASTPMVYQATVRAPYAERVTAPRTTFALPELWLPAGFRFDVFTGNMQAADQWANLRVLISELDRGPLGEQVGTDPETII